jgi:hypothetical protein
MACGAAGVTIYGGWMKLAFDSWALGIEASQVVGLRTMQMATGRASGDEVARMIGEKVEAALTLQAQAMTGRATPATAVRHYRRKVQANRRRLTR